MPEGGGRVFVSYRRRVSWPLARLVVNDLAAHGLDVFVDVDGLGSGDFGPVILREIESREHFVVVLQPASLDRIAAEDDWLRREIAHALGTGRNVVPVLADGFRLDGPYTLPPEIERLRALNAVAVPDDYFDAAMARLRRFLGAPTPAPVTRGSPSPDVSAPSVAGRGGAFSRPFDEEPPPRPAVGVVRVDSGEQRPDRAPSAVADPGAPAHGRGDHHLDRARALLGRRLLDLVGDGRPDRADQDAIVETLLRADVGVLATAEITAALRASLFRVSTPTTAQAHEILRDVLVEALWPDTARALAPSRAGGPPAVVLVAGPDGVDVTAIARGLAGALATDHPVTTATLGATRAGPTGVAVQALERARHRRADVVVHGVVATGSALAERVGMIERAVRGRGAPVDVLLVLDATAGSEGLTWARELYHAVTLSGVVLTRLDATGKAGLAFQAQRMLRVPVMFVGFGDGPADLVPFDPAAFVDALLGAA